MPIDEKILPQILYPCVRVLTSKTGGSGTVIYSQASKGDAFDTYILSCHHVVDDAISVRPDWDSMLGREAKREFRSTVRVEFFKYKNGGRATRTESVDADIRAWDRQNDIALLKLRMEEPIKHIATLYPREKAKEISLFDRVHAVGCALLHPPIVTEGVINSMSDEIDDLSYWMSDAQIIFGNCLRASALIYTNPGEPIPISAIQPGQKVFCLQGGEVVSRSVRRVIPSTAKPLLRLLTNTRAVELSNAHPVLALRRQVETLGLLSVPIVNRWGLAWTRASDLNVGDAVVAMSRIPDSFQSSEQFLPDGRAITSDICRVLGFYVGDGYSRVRPGQGGEVYFYFFNDDRAKRYLPLIASLFGIEASYKDGIASIYSKSAAELVRALGVTGGATTKRIPQWVFALPKGLRTAFVEGYCDADGYRFKNRAGREEMRFEANNRELVAALRVICIGLGWRVCNLSHRMRVGNMVNARYAKPTERSWSFVAMPSLVGENRMLMGLWGAECVKLPTGLTLERIKKITALPAEATFDIEVENAHNFIADGIVVHNSGGAIFHENERGHEFIGIPSRVAVYGWGTAVSHMGYFSDIERIYKWLDSEYYQFLYDAAYTAEKWEKLREAKREKELELYKKRVVEAPEAQ